MRRDWKKNDPVKYFHRHCSHVKSRSQLYREDNGLHLVLLRTGRLNEVLPNKNQEHRDWSKIDPVEYFYKHHSHVKNREQLRKADYGLCEILKKRGRLYELLPKKAIDWSKTDPVEYFHKHHSHVKTRRQLGKENSTLYITLLRSGKLDELLPKKAKNWSRQDPVEYFHKHHSHVKDRKELREKDYRLYVALKKRGRLDEILPEEPSARDWINNDPLQHFYEKFSHIKSKTALRKADNGLYNVLWKRGRLDELFPKKQKQRDWSRIDPVKYAKERYPHVKNVSQLQKADGTLYGILLRTGRLDEVLPEKREQRDWINNDPVEYLIENYPHIKTKSQLYKEDYGLYAILKKTGKLDKVLANKNRDWSKTDPVEYFHKHCPHVKNREQLMDEDLGLYGILRKTNRLDEVLPSDNHFKKEALETAIKRYVG